MAILRSAMSTEEIRASEKATTTNVPGLSLKPEIVTAETEVQHENEWYRDLESDYIVQEQPLHTPRRMHMIVIGAGAAGLNIAYKADRQFAPGTLTYSIYEKNEDVGGTWLENRYPGCTCDIPSHAYQWSFHRKNDWSSYYSGSEEIWQYLKDWSVESGIHEKVRFGNTVQEARWNEDEGMWTVKGVDRTGNAWTEKAEILASCHGVLK